MSAADQGLLDHATQSIAVGSKSFAAASRLFDPLTRRSAVMLYAWCRHCDDVIDGQEAGHSATVISLRWSADGQPGIRSIQRSGAAPRHQAALCA
jgi:phytoene/squalene synthetase